MKNNSEEIEANLQDYAGTKVPQLATVGGMSIGMINGSLAFSVPGLITGVEIGNAFGLSQSIYVFIVGGLILSILGALTGIVGAKNRYSSCMTLKFVFGTKGAAFISTLFVLSLIGWYGVNIDLFSDAFRALGNQALNLNFSVQGIEIFIGIAITFSTIMGFSLIDKVSNYLVPLMIGALLFMLYQALQYIPLEVDGAPMPTFSFGEGVSIVVGSFIVSVVLMPDFSRFARTSKDAVTASFLPFLGLSSFVYIVSAIAGIAVHSNDILKVMLELGLGALAFFLLIAASYITNVINLYSAALGANAIHSKWNMRQLIIFMGLIGTVAASFNLLDNFTDFLFSLSIIFTPVAAIYVVDFFVIRKGKTYQLEDVNNYSSVNISAILAWGLGVLTSMLVNHQHMSLTGLEACDAILVSGATYYIFYRLKHSHKQS